MASYPPPPRTPPPGSPYAFDTRQQRRMQKLQRRMDQAELRIQERLQKRQFKVMHRSSLLVPVVIVLAGLFLLLLRIGHLTITTLAATFDHWWPLALVVAGIVLALEWFYDRTAHHAGSTYIRRGASGGVVLLFLLLAGSGAYLNSMQGDRALSFHGLSITPDNIAEVFGEKHEREEELNLPVPSGTALSFSNPHGDITIAGTSPDNNVHIELNKQLFSTSESEADSEATRLSPTVVADNGLMLVTVPRVNGAQVDLSITTPANASVTVSTENGDIHLTDLRAAVNITQNNGDVELDQVIGAVTAHLNSNNSSFSAENITGDLSLKGHAEDLSLQQITGHVTLEGDFYGDTHLEHLTGPVDFRSNRTQFSLGRLDGQIDISPDEDLIGNQIVGPTILTTRSRNISLDRVTGDLIVSNSNGTVDVTGAAPLANLRIDNRNGAVNLTVPPNSEFTLDAQCQDGQVSNDFGIPTEQAAQHNQANGKVGDGHSHIFISTTHAGVYLHKGDVLPPTSAVPTTPNVTMLRSRTPKST